MCYSDSNFYHRATFSTPEAIGLKHITGTCCYLISKMSWKHKNLAPKWRGGGCRHSEKDIGSALHRAGPIHRLRRPYSPPFASALFALRRRSSCATPARSPKPHRRLCLRFARSLRRTTQAPRPVLDFALRRRSLLRRAGAFYWAMLALSACAGGLLCALPSQSPSPRSTSSLGCAGALSYPSPDFAQSRQLKYLDLRSI